ncbi:cell envelope integrity protein CreD [Persicobacter diffluens]|uniref:Cell envelope integrity protein CreD n=1 Tax=Persicobacter diffluens TaxID=981 RepID=A0AAN4VZ36_9BACT|nr:cell envelope integrity protein CreD [Persicobacter diffluens]
MTSTRFTPFQGNVIWKVAAILVLALLLLIPTSMIKGIISEREALQGQTIEEISNKWAKSQELKAIMISIPIEITYTDEDHEQIKEDFIHFLPDQLLISGNIDPKTLSRGIYQAVVYQSDLLIKGKINIPEIPLEDNITKVHYQKAFATIGISDLRGIKENIAFQWNGEKLEESPGTRSETNINSGVTIPLPLTTSGNYDFEYQLHLQGSKEMNFVPLGKITEVKINSPWQDPAFDGHFLPEHREILQEGFNAEWKILQHNRNFPQQWRGTNQIKRWQSAVFGVKLLSPMDDYRKAMRSAKYAILTIGLTFLVFFLVEILNDRRIHPLQYILVGLALCLFYILLVAISEHSNFNLAYLISSTTVVGMIGGYSASVLGDRKLSFLLLISLATTYAFLFTTLQLTDYALLMGSIGLALILAATMYFTRKIDWYQVNVQTN